MKLSLLFETKSRPTQAITLYSS